FDCLLCFFFQAEDGIRDYKVTGVQTCALPISLLELAAGMRKLARNDADIEIRGADRIDEIGEMARALSVFRTNAIELMLSQRSRSEERRVGKESRSQWA